MRRGDRVTTARLPRSDALGDFHNVDGPWIVQRVHSVVSGPGAWASLRKLGEPRSQTAGYVYDRNVIRCSWCDRGASRRMADNGHVDYGCHEHSQEYGATYDTVETF